MNTEILLKLIGFVLLCWATIATISYSIQDRLIKNYRILCEAMEATINRERLTRALILKQCLTLMMNDCIREENFEKAKEFKEMIDKIDELEISVKFEDENDLA